MTEETLETIILGHIAKELKDEVAIGRQANLAKTIMQALRIHDVVNAERTCAKCNSTDVIMFTADLDICNECGCTQDAAGQSEQLVCPICSRTDCTKMVGIKCNVCQEFTEI